MNPESYKSIIRALADPRAYDKAQREGGLCQYALAEAAQETLMAIDEMTGEMMEGGKFFKRSGLSRATEYSLRQCGYTDHPDFELIESAIAQGKDLLDQVIKLRALMRQYCEREVALYLDVDLDDLRGLVEEHLPKQKTESSTPAGLGWFKLSAEGGSEGVA